MTDAYLSPSLHFVNSLLHIACGEHLHVPVVLKCQLKQSLVSPPKVELCCEDIFRQTDRQMDRQTDRVFLIFLFLCKSLTFSILHCDGEEVELMCFVGSSKGQTRPHRSA